MSMPHGARPVIVGIVNVTPDSFSDGGRTAGESVDHALALLDEGADIVEAGGESTRPGATPVDSATELERVLPVIRGVLRVAPDARIGVDTVKSDVARAALDAGATLVNDVAALRLDPVLAAVCAAAGCTVVLMHSRGGVDRMASYELASYPDGEVGTTIARELQSSVERALDAGVAPGRIVLDAGIGFAKRPEQSLAALAELGALVELGFPVMVGASRKRFIGEITGVADPAARDAGSVGAHVAALFGGATWFRVHAVRVHREALDVAARVLALRTGSARSGAQRLQSTEQSARTRGGGA